MPRVPANTQDLLNFCNEHYTTWLGSPTSIGLVAGDITNLKTNLDAANVAVAAQAAARDAAKAATLTANTKVSTLRKNMAALVRTIVTFAENNADPMAIFSKAQLDPTAPRTPSQPPGQPSNISATLDDEGNITLKWKCTNPAGGNVVYSVMRCDDSEGTFTQVGVTGARMFLDDSIAAGSPSVQYQIRGFRGQMAGDASPIFTLQFGHGGGGSFAMNTTAKAPLTPLKVAA